MTEEMNASARGSDDSDLIRDAKRHYVLSARLSERLNPTALQVLNFYVTPLLFKVFSDKPSMAMMRGRFTAKQTCTIQQISINFRLYVSRSH
jgi:hypothetical protein